ncbi:MAG: UDP-glucose 4-epimerase [Pelotomaculum sp. PtaB.Bin104]|nr:MAG: UDP-glucose 4-epimerase [Pelotomaculum sp. PtaB.Bin104]
MTRVQEKSFSGHASVSLVTGAAGFLGSHLVDRLLSKGHQVVGIDNLSTGNPENLKNALSDKKKFHFIQADVTLNPELPELKYDYIWHLASPASPVDYRRLSIETLLVNSAGTKNILDIALRHKAKFLLASTSEVYGDPLVHPQKEDYWGNVNPIGERACYDESKRFAEALTTEYRRRFGLDARIIRIFNTYGPRMRIQDGRVIPNFISQALRGEPLTVYGNGNQTRSFVYIDNEVEGIMRAMFYENTDGEVINIGNPQEYTILEVARIVAQLCRVELNIIYESLPSDDPTRRSPDLSKARALLGWKPSIPFEIGLTKTIDYFVQRKLKDQVSKK